MTQSPHLSAEPFARRWEPVERLGFRLVSPQCGRESAPAAFISKALLFQHLSPFKSIAEG